MIIGAQIRAARSALGWTSAKLAKEAGIAGRTIIRIESEDGIPLSTANTLNKIRVALESAGIEFIGTPDDAPGIRIHKR